MVLEATCKKIKNVKLNYFLTPYIKINSKWIRDLNIRPEIIKLLGENTAYTLTSILAIFLLDMFLQARETNVKINKWGYIKLKSFHTVKKTNNKIKRQPTEWEKIFTKDMFDKGLISKELTELNIKKTQPD